MHVEQTYPLNVAAKAAQYTTKEFRRQVNNGAFKLQGCDRRSTGSGDPVGYSRRRILQAAIVQHLNRLGMPVSRAALAAAQFTDEFQTRRAPGQLYENGKTILVITPEDATVKNVFYDASLADVNNREISISLVDLNRIVTQVDSILESNV